MKSSSRLRVRYQSEVMPALRKEFGYTNVMLVDPDSSKTTRVGHKTLENKTRVRVARRSGSVLDK